MSAFDSVLTSSNNKSALAGNVGGQARVQEVLSPDWCVDAAREALGGEIGVDPCAPSTPENWIAKHNLTLHTDAVALEGELAQCKKGSARAKEIAKLLKPYYLNGSLVESWGHWTAGAYVNPAFGFLEPWINRCAEEARIYRRVVGLWPLRTHRDWFLPAHAGSEIVLLNYHVVFKGHTSAFPAPLVMVSWNCRIPNLGKRENGRWKP